MEQTKSMLNFCKPESYKRTEHEATLDDGVTEMQAENRNLPAIIRRAGPFREHYQFCSRI